MAVKSILLVVSILSLMAAANALATTSSTTLSTEFNCYVNAGAQPNNATGVMPQFANFTAGDTFCYRAQMPSGLVTCVNDTCTTASFHWNYGVLDKKGCDSFVATQALGIYKNVLCCATPQCNAPDVKLDTTTVKLVNPDIATVEPTTTTADNVTTLPSTTTTTTTTPTTSGTSTIKTTSSNTQTASTTSGASLAGTGPVTFVVLCLAALAAAF